jgi:hypothetical protein
LLLLATSGTLACRPAGLVADTHQWERHLQGNTVRRRAVPSTAFGGRQILASLRFRLRCGEWRRALARLSSLVARYATVP